MTAKTKQNNKPQIQSTLILNLFVCAYSLFDVNVLTSKKCIKNPPFQ